MKNIVIVVFTALIAFLVSCRSKNDGIDLSKINLDVKVKRFDLALFDQNIPSIDVKIDLLSKEYPKFFPLFGERIISIGAIDNPSYSKYLESFISDKMIIESFEKVQDVFPNLDNLNNELTNAFKRFHFYFPQKPIPAIYAYISGFNQSIVIADSLLGISLDRYLGTNCEYYPRLGIPKYSIHDMHPSKISSDCIRSWAIGEFPFNDSIDNLVNNMIYEGTLMYFTKKMLPEQPDSLLFGFTPGQMRWCQRNEEQMWTYLIENKMLFITDSFQINKFINGAPFTSGFSQESPGRAVVWLGYRIVNSFIKKNPNISFQRMMSIRDYQKIFNQSKYRP